ncbi:MULTISPECIES: hypothetical protein [unclassified Pseudofrankia]|uniref:hypothetical protein n=1 Tax=unclassified Pseudofrankia TaxID=2994372 RepID=UPI0008DA8ED3|nr:MULTISPECIES: hypothetical protein [unclassified Pseudofrankia]MDT3444364.1 hypothetical protein [Pseudofrankia sp. BMG5.37]OHV55334.1 hypothetical protein BCD48_08615 [Pseudofrankia sp. BMG5.36]
MTLRRTARTAALAVVAVAAIAGCVPAGFPGGGGGTAGTPTASPSVRPTTSPSVPPTTTPSSPSATPAATTTPPPTATPSGPASSDCGRTAGASPTARITEVSLGSQVVSFAPQGDTDPLPTAIAAAPGGGSWLAWLGTDSKVHLGRLDCGDQLVGTPTSVDGVDLQDIKADAQGVVVLLTRPGPQGSGKLCGGTSSPTKTMWMVRFDNSGRQVWEQQVTNLSGSLGGYDPGALFVWWYNHHGTLAYDGTNYAAYFEAAITVANGSCVDIHEGDRMQVVNATTGSPVSGHDSFAWGCSHAWDSHIVWDARTGHFAMVCATDNKCRIARPATGQTVAAGVCDGTLFGGNIVLAGTQGYWTAWSNGNQTKLEHFSTGASDQTVLTADKTQHSHLAAYGPAKMLLTWKSGTSIAAQVYDSTTGKAVGGQFTIAAPDHTYVEAKDYTDGSVAFPAAGTSTTSIRIVRVMPLA